ncbi:MAG: Tex family protein [Planctomycetota bacterium]
MHRVRELSLTRALVVGGIADPIALVSRELGVAPGFVRAVVRLLTEGNTVPFVARYRKEATGGLDEVQIRSVQERWAYLEELAQRKATVLESIAAQGKLTDTLREGIEQCTTKSELEDLYLPFKPKRRTRGAIARERGLEALALQLRALPRTQDTPESLAAGFVAPGREVPDVAAALAGARDIVAEIVAELPEVRRFVRGLLLAEGVLRSRVVRGKQHDGQKFAAYFDHREPAARCPSHRYLAMRRGEQDGILKVGIEVALERVTHGVRKLVGWHAGSPCSGQVGDAIDDACERLLVPSLESEVRGELREHAERAAIDVFARNLEHLLLAAPFGARPVLGIDPGLRTGCKCASVSATGKLLGHATIYPLTGDRGSDKAARDLLALVRGADLPAAVAIGNGTGGRETEAFVRRVLSDAGLAAIPVVAVSEAGASVYSASDVAREEFPDLDVTLRGAVSIARRLQDPLSELVKVEPRSIGVGQYQHDVAQPALKQRLDHVVESCVNRVGVDVNTASAALLSYVAGIGRNLAKKIVAHRDQQGAFRWRARLLEVSGLGPKTFEQAAGFLRVNSGDHPLDASAVHPERYSLVERMARDVGTPVADLIGNEPLLRSLDPQRYVADDVGLPTLADIIAELRKPGRDPRESFVAPRFREDVQQLADLREGMTLEGVVTNVTDFGAFVDVGVHQDGLVHISQLADHFVRDPHEVVQVGDKIQVRVLAIDLDRKRVSLSAKRGS